MLATALLPNPISDTTGLPVKRGTGRLQRLTAAVASAKPFYQELTTASATSAEQLLVKLLQRHCNESGWIVLVAPKQLPSKALANYLGLPVDKILIIHSDAIKDPAKTLHKLLHTSRCRVVINFGQPGSEQLTSQLSQCAASQQRWFYQVNQVTTQTH
ncbi:SulA-like leucine-rich domain-containing protein [Arsukibacterium sp.]|uniref:SulA-like leucine-rich domain-containing protein n=1 Tax=Arsukibacterium sp. TaxID=1977258 RepID=UPI001BD1CF87|nr:SulA-like leucine-rich domain-containing protein [Arsukibacterium sp.]